MQLAGIFNAEEGSWQYDVYAPVAVSQDPYDDNLSQATRVRATYNDSSLSRDASGCLVGPPIHVEPDQPSAPCGVSLNYIYFQESTIRLSVPYSFLYAFSFGPSLLSL